MIPARPPSAEVSFPFPTTSPIASGRTFSWVTDDTRKYRLMTKKYDVEVPILIVGGGGAGLTSSILLSRLGVESLLVTRYPSTTHVPRAHILNQRSMEIFADMGVDSQIRAKSTPQENMSHIGYFS